MTGPSDVHSTFEKNIISKCCENKKLIHKDNDIVCCNCGVIHDESIVVEPILQKSKIPTCDEGMIGSADISPSSILHSQRHRNILESRVNPYEKKLFDVCSVLSIPQTQSRRVLYLFRCIINAKKMPLGMVAFFSIYQTCKENDVKIDDTVIILAIQSCFVLKRKIKPKKAIFMAHTILLDSEKKVHLDFIESDAKKLHTINSESLRRSAIRLSKKYGKIEKTVNMLDCMGVDE